MPGPAWRTLIYALTLSGLFGASAAYHLGDWSEPAYVRMRRLDHSMIFVLIAGTYTPYCLLVLQGTIATIMLIAVWAGAAVGVATKFYRVDLHVLSGFMYIGLGWIVAVSLPALLRGLDTAETLLLIAGGLLYSFGALVLATNGPTRGPARSATTRSGTRPRSPPPHASTCRSCSSCSACAAS